MRLKDKVAIITGAASGIGKETAILFAKEGATVIGTDIQQDLLKNLESENPNIHGYLLNVTDRPAIASFVEEIKSKYSKIDILINNAGITADALLIKMSEENWDKVININLKGVFNMTQAVVPVMISQAKGVVLSTSSVVGRYGNVGQTNYAASKAGVIAMTYSWSKEYGKKGIRFNAVAPGFIRTPMTEKLPENVINMMVEKTPLRKFGEPSDVANAFLFLASDEATYITGQVLGVDGGLVM